jgi:hypothetical protein
MKNVSVETLQQTKEILRNYDLYIVQDASAGAATFYQWVSDV